MRPLFSVPPGPDPVPGRAYARRTPPRWWAVALALAMLFGPFDGATARQRPDAVTLLSPAARARLVPDDTTLAFRTRRVPGGRIDTETGIFRAVYRLDGVPAPAASPEAAARAYLRRTAGALGLRPDLADLVLEQITASGNSRHVVFRQTLGGVPVYGRRLKVNLDRAGRPAMVLNAYAPHLKAVRDFDPRPSRSAPFAAARALDEVAGGRGRTSTPELVVFPSDPPRLAWHLLVWPETAPAEWSVFIDAHTGTLLYLFDQAVRDRFGGPAPTPVPSFSPYRTGPPPLPEHTAVHTEAAFQPARRIDGSGFVFDPDPLSTSGQTYAPPYVDNNDADNAALSAERILVDLRDITQGTDGLFRLQGPHVRIEGSATTGFTPPAELDPHAFRYTRSQPGFEAVMAYYHIDKSQRHIQRLGFFNIQNGPIPVQPRARTDDNSFYYPVANRIEFGLGGVDDAEDAFVIWHEYGHAVLEAAAPGLLNTAEGQALHEGWSDYWAASYVRSLIEQGLSKRQDWEQLFKWDSGDGAPELWGGRRLDHPGHYPEDTPCARSASSCDIWQDGTLWATTLMEIYDVIGRDALDALNLYAFRYLSAPVTMADAAEAIIQADLDHFGGAHFGVLLDVFGARGFVDPAAFGPVVAHEALPSTEQLGGTVPLDVEASSHASSVDTVYVYFGHDAEPATRLVLAPAGNDRFTGELPLPETAATVRYFVEAVDALGRRTRLPTTAPAETFRFTAGPDHEPPSVTHTPITQASLATWPAEVVASVEDNLGVDSARVTFTLLAPEGEPVTEGAFGLTRTNGLYRGVFPVPVHMVQHGSQVRYRLHARDRAAAANETALPGTGTFDFTITARGVLRVFDFEAGPQEVTATGAWAHGRPAFGVQVAHSGQFVWATTPGGPYPDTAGRSSLELPPLNLKGLDQAYLVFWHWYDLEHNGLVEPGHRRHGRILWDGANVKVSTDGGTTWTVVEPEGGYNGTVFDTPDNPLRGQPAFGGYSFGWRQETIPLPAADDVRIRFDLGTDTGNTDVAVQFAGWYLDDVLITTDRPVDAQRPTLPLPPPPLVVRSVQESPLSLSFQINDDTGVAEAIVVYEVTTALGSQADSLRLAMRPNALDTYEGTIPLGRAPRPGDLVRYRLHVRDFAGNETRLPAGDDRYHIEYRLVESTSLLGAVRASGLWQAAGATWITGSGSETRSSLVLEPLDLPANAADLTFTLEHRYSLGNGLGGNVKISADDGHTWQILTPEGGYDATLPAGSAHPMQGEAVFTGASEGPLRSVFDLARFAGAQVRLRIDFGAGRSLRSGEFWQVQAATFGQSTRENAFEVPRTLRLLGNFPDPFATTTTISYTLPERLPVTLEVYDALGRRVARLVQATQEAGTYTLTFDAGHLAAGVYLLRLLAGDAQRIERMVVAR
ncbi:T9SS type A sorting domain-containing protein [Rhodocaloribacter litoris]|uniref:T9SS type A sorting domain-containing protein n=1 Tax=Rhodocaloribacter litoris TaxID=2558931 RepID=UPI0014211203|nr:T9SS type A sorting domain-containing protein [Rhodocaloribacter litoris]QXD16864.1 T9SS type A sorting domain-containing protein [Rhodocaloribacter litoris]